MVLSNKESLKVAKGPICSYVEDLKRTKELVESGVVPRGDLLEIEATAANQEQTDSKWPKFGIVVQN